VVIELGAGLHLVAELLPQHLRQARPVVVRLGPS
jgi:hypothetical protein